MTINNPAIYDSVLSGIAASNGAWLQDDVAGDYLAERNAASVIATTIDGAIPTILSGVTTSQRLLAESITKSVMIGRSPRSVNPSDYSSLAQAVAAAFTEFSAILVDSSTGADQVASDLTYLRNHPELIADGSISLLSHTTLGDGGAGEFYWDALNVTADNDGTIIAVVGVATGRWVRLFSGAVNVQWFGAKGPVDSSTAVRAAIAFCRTQTKRALYVPTSNYLVSRTAINEACLWIDFEGLTIFGDGEESSTFTIANNYDVIVHFSTEKNLTIPPSSTIDGLTIRDVGFRGTGVYEYFGLAFGRLILGRNSLNMNIHDCEVDGASMIGICAEGNAGYNEWINNTLKSCKYTALNLNGIAYGSVLSGNVITGTNGNINSCAIQASGNCITTNNTIYGDSSSLNTSGGILWGEGDYNGIGTIGSNYIAYCGYGIKQMYHGPCNTVTNTVFCCSGSGGGILSYGGTTLGYTVASSDNNLSDNLVVNCAPYQIEVTAENTSIRNNTCLNITAPTQATAPGNPNYIALAVIPAGIAIRANGVSAVNNTINGAGVGISLLMGITPREIGKNSFVNCTSDYAQENPALYKYSYIDALEHVTTTSGYVYELKSSALPTVGYFTVGSGWSNSAPSNSTLKFSQVEYSGTTTVSVQANAGDTVITVASSAGMINRNVVGILLDDGSIHWSLATLTTAVTITLTTPIPALRHAAITATVWINGWTPSVVGSLIPIYPFTYGPGSLGLVLSPSLPIGNNITENAGPAVEGHNVFLFNPTFTLGKFQTLKVKCKSNGRDCVHFSDGVASGASFNLITGTVLPPVGNAVSSIVALGNGTYECVMTMPWPANSIYIWLTPDGTTFAYVGASVGITVFEATIETV